MSRLIVRSKKFTPSEAEAVSGATPNQQRVWRSRGLLPAKTGKQSRYDPETVAYMLALKQLSDASVMLEPVHGSVRDAAAMIVFHAVTCVRDCSAVASALADLPLAQLALVASKLEETGHRRPRRFLSMFGGNDAWLCDDLNEPHNDPNVALRYKTSVTLSLQALGMRLGDRVESLKWNLFEFEESE